MSTIRHLELPLFKARPADDHVLELVRILKEHTRWMTAVELCRLTGWSDRQVRALAEASDGWIISGQLGYAHIASVTVEEVDHCCNAWESQARRMESRAIRTRRRAHERMG